MTLTQSKKNKIFRKVLLAFVILVFSVLQNMPGRFLQIGGARALIIIPLVTAIAMFEREKAGMLFGLFAGALWDIYARGNNFNMIYFLIVGFVCGMLIKTIMRNNFVTHFILTGFTAAVYLLGYWLFHYVFAGLDGVLMPLISNYIPSFIFTMIITVPVFFFVRFLETPSKTKQVSDS